MSKVLVPFGAWLIRLALTSTVFAIVSWGQGTPPMRTRYLTSLTNTESKRTSSGMISFSFPWAM